MVDNNLLCLETCGSGVDEEWWKGLPQLLRWKGCFQQGLSTAAVISGLVMLPGDEATCADVNSVLRNR